MSCSHTHAHAVSSLTGWMDGGPVRHGLAAVGAGMARGDDSDTTPGVSQLHPHLAHWQGLTEGTPHSTAGAVPQSSLHFVSLCLLTSPETGLHQPMANLSHLPCAIKRPNLAQHHGASLGCRGTNHATPWWCSPRTLTHIPSVCVCGPLPASCQSFHSVPYCCIAKRQA